MQLLEEFMPICENIGPRAKIGNGTTGSKIVFKQGIDNSNNIWVTHTNNNNNNNNNKY